MAAAAEGVSTSSWAKEAGSLSPAAQRMEAAILDLTLSRRSLGATFKEQAKQVKQYNPRFEEDYVAGKDYDVDRDRSDRKRLRRDLKREKRGAMRELRKDNKFLATVKNRERDQTKEDLQKKIQQAIPLFGAAAVGHAKRGAEGHDQAQEKVKFHTVKDSTSQVSVLFFAIPATCFIVSYATNRMLFCGITLRMFAAQPL